MEILVVEDDLSVWSVYEGLCLDTEWVFAMTVAEATQKFQASGGMFLAIVMDGFLVSQEDSSPFIRFARQQGYKGPMIATSSKSDQMKVLLAAGCDMECPKLDGMKLRGILDGLIQAERALLIGGEAPLLEVLQG